MKNFTLKIWTMNKIFLFCLFLSLCAFNINAVPHSIVTLKNGSVINGDIVMQRFGKEMTIEAENAIFVINPKDIISKKTRKVKYENLSREMKRWVLENRALKGDAYGRYAELEDIKTQKYSFSGLIRKPNEGTQTSSYIQVSPTTYNVKWNDVQNIGKVTSYGIKDELSDNVTTFANKKYVGKIVSQKIGDNVTMETTKGLVTIPNKEIKEIRKSKPDGSISFFNHIDFLNVIVLKNGTEKEGLITLHHYGSKDKDNYVTLLDKNGKSDNIQISTISEFRTKFENNDMPIYSPGKVYINEFKIDNASSQRAIDKIVFIDKQVFPFPEGISITFKAEGDKLSGNWSLVALSELPTAYGKSSWGYEFAKKAENTITPSSTDNLSLLRQISYGYLSPGYYALVNDTDTNAYVFKITK